jgi:hypothetical protein
VRPLDPETLTPGIRRLVMALRARGWDTTDSGDGVTNVAAGMEGAMDVPHVVIDIGGDLIPIEASACALLDDAKELLTSLDGVHIEASYSPLDGAKIILITGADDSRLRGGA